jgi:hypothetical protein
MLAMHSCLQTKKPYVYACKHANHVGPSARKQTKIWYKFYFLGYKLVPVKFTSSKMIKPSPINLQKREIAGISDLNVCEYLQKFRNQNMQQTEGCLVTMSTDEHR